MILALTISAIVLFYFNFYYAPDGKLQKDENTVIAPCYGTIYSIEELPDQTTHITCFLSPTDVHMQYSPVNGIVSNTVYDRTGKFNLAYDLGKSRLNEKRIHTINFKHGECHVYQVAGYLTRRISSWIDRGEPVIAGQSIGFIHLGSRVDLIIPRCNLLVKVGDKLEGGKQIIGFYKSSS